MLVRMLMVVMCGTLLAGCATNQRCGSGIGVSEVQGLGSGETRSDALRAAWDDAIERIDDMGIENYDTKIIESRTGKGVGKPYEGMVLLRVTRQIDRHRDYDDDDDHDEDEDEDEDDD